MEAWEFKDWTNVFCNQARTDDVPYTMDACSKWLINNLQSLYDRLNPEARILFKFDRPASKTHKKKTGEDIMPNRWTNGVAKSDPRYNTFKWSGDMRTSAIYSIACTLINPIDYDLGDAGQPRLRPYTQQLQVGILLSVMCSVVNHQRGGVAS